MKKHVLYQISDPQGGTVYIGSYTVPSEYKYMIYGSNVKAAMRKYFMDGPDEVNMYLYDTHEDMVVKYNELVAYWFDTDNGKYKLSVDDGDSITNVDYMGVRDANGYLFITGVSDLRYTNGDLVCFSSGRVVVRSGSGDVGYCEPFDYVPYSGVSLTRGMALVRDRRGGFSFVPVEDERIGGGELEVFWCGMRKTAQMRARQSAVLSGTGCGPEHVHYGKRWVYRGSVSKLVPRDQVNVLRADGWFPGRKPRATVS